MQQPRNFDDLKFSSIHRRIMLWGSGGPFLDGYVLVIIGVALEQLTPLLHLDAEWIGALGAATLAGLLSAPRCLAIFAIKSGGVKCSCLILSLSALSPWRPCCSTPLELLVMRV